MVVVVRLQYHEWMASIIARSLGCLLQFWYVIPVILVLYSNSSSISVGVSITTGTILSYQRALACWGKSKLEARHQQEITNPITKRLSWAVPTHCRAATTPTFLLSPPLRFCWEQISCIAGSCYVMTHVEILRKAFRFFYVTDTTNHVLVSCSIITACKLNFPEQLLFFSTCIFNNFSQIIQGYFPSVN